MKQELPSARIDVKAFAQAAASMSGVDLLSKYERLMEEVKGLGSDRTLTWHAQGELRTDELGADQVWLHLTAEVSLPMTCQRCLGPVDIPVAVNRSFRFVGSEEAAEEQDEEAEEDVLALSPDFNLSELIEDEVLMELPVVPRHEECPVELKLAAVDPDFDRVLAEKTNPFAALAKLRDPKLG